MLEKSVTPASDANNLVRLAGLDTGQVGPVMDFVDHHLQVHGVAILKPRIRRQHCGYEGDDPQDSQRAEPAERPGRQALPDHWLRAVRE